jgi:iron complex outermembrane receptor protein
MAASLVLVLAAKPFAQRIDTGALQQLFAEPVTTSATGKPQRASDAPADIEIIAADDIRRSGADNLPDVLRFVAGLDVRRYGFAAADVGVRGYNETSNPRLLVLLDGQQVYLDDLGRTQWYTLPVILAEIKQIEVIKGPNTALFGFNAASGVINIITYDPLYDRPLNVAQLYTGTQNYTRLSAVGTGRIADMGGIRAFVDGFRASEFAPIGIVPEDLAFREMPQEGAFGFNGRFHIAPGIELSAFGAKVNSRMWEATSSPYFGTDFQRTNWSRLALTADTQVGLINLSAYRNELSYEFNGASEREDLHDTVYALQLSDVMKLNAQHSLHVELDYRNNAATSSDILPGRIGYQVVSGSAMWDWQITPRLTLTNAIRFDHLMLNQHGLVLPQIGLSSADFNGATINEPSFNSGLVWNATSDDTFRLLAGRGLQLPSIYDFGLQDLRVYPGDGQQAYTSQTFLAAGNPFLNATSVANVELAWDHKLEQIAAQLHAAIFVQRTDNVLTNPYEVTPVFTNFPDGSQFALAQAMNTGRSTARGIELGLHGQTEGGFRWKASYSYISIYDDTSINNGGFYSPQDFAHGTPANVLVLGAGYTHDRWEFDSLSRWQSRFLDYRVSATDPSLTQVRVNNEFILNARIGYTLAPRVILSLVGQQLNTAQQLQAAAPPVERRVILSLTAGF